MNITDNFITNMIFLFLIIFVSAYSFKKGKRQNGLAFAIFSFLYLIYFIRSWF